MGDFSPHLMRSPIPPPPGLCPVFQGACPGPSRRSSLKTTDKRFPLDRPRHPSGRQLDGLPGGGTRVIMRAVWARRWKWRWFCFSALNFLDFAIAFAGIEQPRSPSMDSPLDEPITRW